MQVKNVRTNRIEHRSELIVHDATFRTGLFHELTDGRIMYMTDSGEEMMLYLEVQATK